MLVGRTALKMSYTSTTARMAVGIIAMMHVSAACFCATVRNQIGRQAEYFRMMMVRKYLGNQHQHADYQQNIRF